MEGLSATGGDPTCYAYVITNFCLRDVGCVEVCPVKVIVPGYPIDRRTRLYIDTESCIECAAWVPECPNEAIYPWDEILTSYIAIGGEIQSMPVGTPGFETR
jgi:NAD-dependent dihydropyrimidine dehydrogenase PreA subunit